MYEFTLQAFHFIFTIAWSSIKYFRYDPTTDTVCIIGAFEIAVILLEVSSNVEPLSWKIKPDGSRRLGPQQPPTIIIRIKTSYSQEVDDFLVIEPVATETYKSVIERFTVRNGVAREHALIMRLLLPNNCFIPYMIVEDSTPNRLVCRFANHSLDPELHIGMIHPVTCLVFYGCQLTLNSTDWLKPMLRHGKYIPIQFFPALRGKSNCRTVYA